MNVDIDKGWLTDSIYVTARADARELKPIYKWVNELISESRKADQEREYKYHKPKTNIMTEEEAMANHCGKENT